MSGYTNLSGGLLAQASDMDGFSVRVKKLNLKEELLFKDHKNVSVNSLVKVESTVPLSSGSVINNDNAVSSSSSSLDVPSSSSLDALSVVPLHSGTSIQDLFSLEGPDFSTTRDTAYHHSLLSFEHHLTRFGIDSELSQVFHIFFSPDFSSFIPGSDGYFVHHGSRVHSFNKLLIQEDSYV